MQGMGRAQKEGFLKGIEDLSRLKEVMDGQLLKGTYSGWRRTVINFKGPLCLASTGAISPNRDFKGMQLQTLHDPDARIQELLFGIVASREGGAAVFLCREEDVAPKAFIDSLLTQDSKMLCSLIVQFAFAYLENTYFSKDWWESLSEADRKHLSSLAWVGNAYYDDFAYSLSPKIVPWNTTGVAVNDEEQNAASAPNPG